MRQRLRQSSYRFFAWSAAWLLVTAMSVAPAQESAPAAPPKSQSAPSATPAAKPPAETPLPNEIQPNIFYLPDKDGKLQAVLGFPFEEFFELHKLKNQLEQQSRPPSFSIQFLKLSGSTVAARAELTADFAIVVHESGWVRVPLRLTGAMLREQPVFDGPGDHVVDRAPEGDGYIAWIRGAAGKTHRISLRLWAAVVQVGSESHLRLGMPRSTTSELQFQVPLEKAVARVSEGSTLESLKSAGGGKTLLGVAGLSGEFDLAWQNADNQVARLPTVLEASGAIVIRIDGRNVGSEAKLTVRSSGGEFDRFQVRLPPGANYVPTPQVGVTLTPVEGAAAQGKLYEVRLARPTAGPVDVRLVTERAAPPQTDEAAMELAGFEVPGAVRQWGTTAVRVEGNWQVQWGPMRHVRQIDELARMLGQENPAAEFEYSVQPYSLTARVRPQETRIRVEGDYVVLIGGDEAQLRAKLKYTVRGAKVRSLEIDAPGWDVDLLGPGNMVNVDAVAAGQNSPLVIPLLQAASGELEVTFEARQKIARESGPVSLRLPVPRAQSAAPANVTIVPADNVELLVDSEKTEALIVQSIRPKTVALPERQQEPLFLRTAGDKPMLVASIKVHEQEITSSIAAQLELDDRETRVDERMAFQISYQPTDRLLVGVPRTIRPEQLSVTLDGQRLSLAAAREQSDERPSSLVPMRLNLPAPRIGRCELQIKYAVPHEKLADQANTLVGVPLVIPGEGKLTANELVVTPQAGVTVKYPKGPWTQDATTGGAANATGLRLSAASALGDVALAVSFKERHREHVTTIEQAWVQSRLTETRRQDRAVFRFTTSEPSLRIPLPPGADLASLELEMDGRRVAPELAVQGESRELVVPVSSATSGQRVLELRYQFGTRPPRGAVALEAPQIKPGGWMHHMYWHVVLPASEHVLGAPPNFAREYRWVWSNLFWHRQPSLGDRELESWIGAAPSTQSGRLVDETDDQSADRKQDQANSVNRYLFSTVGAAEPLALYTLSRTWLVLFASLPLLLCGLLFIYVPAARHPAALFVLVVAVLAASLIDPEAAVLLAQGASLGLLLAAVAFLLARASAGPAEPVAPVRGSSRAIERPYTEIYGRSGPSGSQPSTATNPIAPSAVPESPS